ncbi:hypothetical protein D3C77_389700 [compost metagenome]
MPQVHLALAAVLGAELDVFLPPRVLHAQFVVGRGAQDVALVVAQGDGVGVAVVVQGVGDEGAVRVAVLEGHRHFGAGQQRQVQAVGVTGVRPRQAQPDAFLAGVPAVAVEEEVDPVAAFDIDVAVGVVGVGAGDPRRYGAGHLRLGLQFGAKAHGFDVGKRLEVGLEAAVTGGAGAQAGEYRARCEGLGGAVGDFQPLPRRQGSAAADAAQAGLAIEVALVAQARVEIAAFAEQVFVLVDRITALGVGLGVVVGLAVGGPGATGLVDFAVERGGDVAVVVGADVDVLFHHFVLSLQAPHAVLVVAVQTRLRPAWQRVDALVVALVVVKLDDVDAQAFVDGEAKPDAHLGQQAGDEGQVAFAVLHHLVTRGVLAHQGEDEVLAEEVVATAQDVLDDLRHRFVLVDAVLLAAVEQGQARLQGELVAGFVP